eukprot:191980-Amphidinium_carterae.1
MCIRDSSNVLSAHGPQSTKTSAQWNTKAQITDDVVRECVTYQHARHETNAKGELRELQHCTEVCWDSVHFANGPLRKASNLSRAVS